MALKVVIPTQSSDWWARIWRAVRDRRCRIRATGCERATADFRQADSSGVAQRDVHRFRGYAEVQRAHRSEATDREVSAGQGTGGLRPYDERQGAVPGGAGDWRVRAAFIAAP